MRILKLVLSDYTSRNFELKFVFFDDKRGTKEVAFYQY